MIESFYVPTRGVDFLTATCVTDSPQRVTVYLESDGGEIALEPSQALVRDDGRTFWRFAAEDLAANQAVELSASQGEDEQCSLTTATLAPPPGVCRLRFGIVSDPHCTPDRDSNKRLFAESFGLLTDALHHLGRLGAAFVVIPGDLTEQGTSGEIEACRKILADSPVPAYPMIGNHEKEPRRFFRAFGLGDGYYSFDHGEFHFVCLRTVSASDLSVESDQGKWLSSDLSTHAGKDTFLFSHYPLVKHPYLYEQEDSDREVNNTGEIGALLGGYPQIRAAFAGHKNIPTRTDQDHVAHIICPQTVQYPCGFDLIDVYDGGFVRHVFEIDQLHLIRRSRNAHPSPQAALFRYGVEEGRNFSVTYPIPKRGQATFF